VINVPIKPMSVNKVWQGKRFKTKEYKQYEQDVLTLLPKIDIPDGDLEIRISAFFSTRVSDLDNIAKPFIDILQKKYGFNDSRVYRLLMTKYIVPKGKESISFVILEYS